LGETDGVDTADGIGTGLTIDHAVYGRIPAEQYVNTGAYADVITVALKKRSPRDELAARNRPQA
jgi:spore coat protein U-like protein